MRIETDRLVIAEFTANMAQVVHENSLDENTRRFVPDEVFETAEDARAVIDYLISQYGGTDGPLAYPVLLKENGANIGYVQMVPLEDGIWEIGYHIAGPYTGRGYATEAVRAFLPVMADILGISRIHGICLRDNAASARILQKCGFVPVWEGTGCYQGMKREIIRSVWERESSK